VEIAKAHESGIDSQTTFFMSLLITNNRASTLHVQLTKSSTFFPSLTLTLPF